MHHTLHQHRVELAAVGIALTHDPRFRPGHRHRVAPRVRMAGRKKQTYITTQTDVELDYLGIFVARFAVFFAGVELVCLIVAINPTNFFT